MRGRPRDPKSSRKMRLHRTNGHIYASTVTTLISKKTGKPCRTYMHWGTLENEKIFQPNLKFQMLSISEQNEFIFPADWDISSLKNFSHVKKQKMSVTIHLKI